MNESRRDKSLAKELYLADTGDLVKSQRNGKGGKKNAESI